MSEKKVSVNEFKNWLDGVLDFQPDDWVPNAEQWKKIRDKIGQLQESEPPPAEPQPVVQQQPPQPQQPRQPKQPPTGRNPRPSGPLSSGAVLDDEKVKLPDTEIEKHRHVKAQKTGQAKVIDSGSAGGPKVIDTGVTHKMDTIDTSDGNYKSSFI